MCQVSKNVLKKCTFTSRLCWNKGKDESITLVHGHVHSVLGLQDTGTNYFFTITYYIVYLFVYYYYMDR